MPWSKHGLHPDEDTIADLLKKQGYATGIFGKWHLGHHEQFLPLQQGFDEYLGLPYSNDMWPVGYDGEAITKNSEGQKLWKMRYPQLPLIDGNKKVDEIRTIDDQGTLTTRYTERAVNFINKHKDEPFFLYVPHSMPHVPLGVSDKFKGKSKQGMYGDVIMEIDWSVGEILKALKTNGLDENTLVVFASDNGPWMNFGNHAGSALPLREGKGSMWEGGPRVPCIMRWPGKIAAASQCDNIAATMDLLPTFSAISGAPLPKNKIDGVNILPLLKSEPGANPRDSYNYYYGGELCAVRQGDWKLYFPHEYRSYVGVEPGMDGNPGPYAVGKAGLELYNLKNDISETKDVAKDHPEIVEQLKKLGQKARVELGDRLTDTEGNGVRPAGQMEPEENQKVSHLAVGKKVMLHSQYHKKYHAGGENALADGLRGTSVFTDGTWQGYEGANLEAQIDLGKTMAIKKLTCGFLESQGDWIFLPAEVEFAVSQDGNHFKPVAQFKEETPQPRPIPAKKDFAKELEKNTEARYVRVRAKNIGSCPQWHPGFKGKAWLFADEFVVE